MTFMISRPPTSICHVMCIGDGLEPGGILCSTYAPRGGGVKSSIHFHYILHAKRGKGVQIACQIAN